MLWKKFNIFSYGLIAVVSLIISLGVHSSAWSQVVGVSLTPQFIWPTQGVISQGFDQYQHEGIDIAGPAGTPILAAASGVVLKAGWDHWGLGNAIEIQHFDDSVTIYGHNRRLLVSQGQRVEQGEMIAEMGSTGNSSGPHLHFEVYPHGRLPADPMPLLASMTTEQNRISPDVLPSYFPFLIPENHHQHQP
jgi:lipoprotein NlpD